MASIIGEQDAEAIAATIITDIMGEIINGDYDERVVEYVAGLHADTPVGSVWEMDAGRAFDALDGMAQHVTTILKDYK